MGIPFKNRILINWSDEIKGSSFTLFYGNFYFLVFACLSSGDFFFFFKISLCYFSFILTELLYILYTTHVCVCVYAQYFFVSHTYTCPLAYMHDFMLVHLLEAFHIYIYNIICISVCIYAYEHSYRKSY